MQVSKAILCSCLKLNNFQQLIRKAVATYLCMYDGISGKLSFQSEIPNVFNTVIASKHAHWVTILW